MINARRPGVSSGAGSNRALARYDKGVINMGLKTSYANPGLIAVREGDSYDPWGTVMIAFFDVASVLYALDPDAIPAKWGYGAGCGAPCGVTFGKLRRSAELRARLEPGARELVDAMAALSIPVRGEGDTVVSLLVHAGNVLDRCADALRAAGRDY